MSRGPIWLLLKARLRSSVRRVVVLVVLTALGGGIALAVAAGARRTAAANDDVNEFTNASLMSSSYIPLDPAEAGTQLRAIPAIGGISQQVGFVTVLTERPVPGLNSFAFGAYPITVDKPVVLEGRLPETASEVFLNEAAADSLEAEIGQSLDVLIANGDFTEFQPETVHVTGVGIVLDSVYTDETGRFPLFAYAPAFIEAHPDSIVWGGASVIPAPGASESDLEAQMVERGFLIDNFRAPEREQARAAIRPLVVTLSALALLAGLATVVLVVQAINRLVHRSPVEQRSLAAAGCGHGVVLAADLGVTTIVGVAGVIGAIGVAVAASPLFPQGRARRIAELRGFEIDATVLGLGAVALLVALGALVAATSRVRQSGRPPRPGTAPGVLGAQPAIATGVRFATGRRGLAATIGGAAVGLAAIVTAVTFTGSTQRLVSRPELAGFSWDLAGLNGFGAIDTDAVQAALEDDPNIERVAAISYVDTKIDGRSAPGGIWKAIEGSPWPPLTGGRAPETASEVLVGPTTLETLGREIGDRVTVSFATDVSTESNDVEMTIVGTAISPALGMAGADTPRLDVGLLLRPDSVPSGNFVFGGAMLFDLVDGADPELVRSRFPEGLPDDLGGTTSWFESAHPAEVIQTDAAIEVLELTITVLLVGVIATVAHNLLGFVRQRRSAFAVLKALGFTPGQIRGTVLSQSGLVMALALVLALPLGVAAGRWLYRGFAGGIGVIVQPVVPPLALVSAVVVAVALVQAVALVPARRARQTNAARELQLEA